MSRPREKPGGSSHEDPGQHGHLGDLEGTPSVRPGGEAWSHRAQLTCTRIPGPETEVITRPVFRLG